MIELDLLKIFKTGQFHNLRVGETKDWMKKNFPAPDCVIDENFWRYGNIDFFFEEERLVEICCRMIDPLLGGDSFVVREWILSDIQKLTLPFVIENLLTERIDFTSFLTIKEYAADPSIGLNKEWYACQNSIGLLDSSTYLLFQPEEPETADYINWVTKEIILVNQNQYKLVGFSLFKDLQKLHEIRERNKLPSTFLSKKKK